MPWVDVPNAEYGDKLYKLVFELADTPFLRAYETLFPGNVGQNDLKPHYEILNDETNKELIVAIYQNGNLDIGGLAKKLSLPTEDVRRRIDFFKANGLRRDVAKKYI